MEGIKMLMDEWVEIACLLLLLLLPACAPRVFVKIPMFWFGFKTYKVDYSNAVYSGKHCVDLFI